MRMGGGWFGLSSDTNLDETTKVAYAMYACSNVCLAFLVFQKAMLLP
jgi:hypothetical protein